MNRALRLLTIQFVFASLGLSLLRVIGADSPWLFEPVAPSENLRPLSGPALQRSGTSTARPIRWNGGRPALAWRIGEEWRIPSPRAEPLGLRVREVRLGSGGVTEVRGELDQDPGSEVLLVQGGPAIAATLRTRDGRSFSVHPGANGLHWIVEHQPELAPGCGNLDSPAAAAQARALARLAAGPLRSSNAAVGITSATPGPTATNIIDLAFVFTPAAESGAGGPDGLRALLRLAVLEANDAFARSGARLQLRSVTETRVDYMESGNLATDLDRLTRDDALSIPGAHALEQSVAADVMCLVVESEASNTLAGMANMLFSTTPDALGRGFLVCVRPYLIGNYTLPHEVGHVLGCDHDRANSVGGGIEAWSYGNRIFVEGVQYRTVMAYRPGTQFPYFSSPEVLFRGVPTGVAAGANAADNVRTLNFTAPLVAAVREPGSRVGFEVALSNASESSGSARVTLVRSGAVTEGRVRVATTSGTALESRDFIALSQTLALPAGQARFSVDIPILDNPTADGPRRFAVALSEPSTNLALGPVTVTTVVINDDETEASAVIDSGFRAVPGADHSVAALALEPSDMVLAGGSFATADGAVHPRLARFLADGRADDAFGPIVKYRVNALARWPDGRVVLGGDFNTVNQVRLNHLAILRSDGTLDPGFEFDAGSDFPVNAVCALPDGRILAGGRFTQVQGRTASRVARLGPDGQPDAKFTGPAIVDGEVRALAIDAFGRILVAGAFQKIGSRSRPGLDRWLADGASDPTFSAEGSASGAVHAVAVDPDGNVLASGAFTNFLGRPVGRVVRLTARGAVDAAFQSGKGADDAIFAMAVTGGGSVWVGGAFRSFDGRPRSRIARLHADGSLDETFDPGIGPNDTVLAIAAREAGGVVIGGVFTQVNGVDRGGIAVLLGGAPRPAHFLGVRWESGRLEWEASAEPRQAYELESSADLMHWAELGRYQPATGSLSGVQPAIGQGAGAEFLRLRRRLE